MWISRIQRRPTPPYKDKTSINCNQYGGPVAHLTFFIFHICFYFVNKYMNYVNRYKYIFCKILTLTTPTWHTRASSVFSLTVSSPLGGLPRILTRAAAAYQVIQLDIINYVIYAYQVIYKDILLLCYQLFMHNPGWEWYCDTRESSQESWILAA